MDSDWWFAKHDNDVGLIPATYVEEQQNKQIIEPAQQPRISETADAEQQKNKLLNALGGLGFGRKSETKEPTGIIYGPDDVTYYTIVELDKKKKKNSIKGLFGVSKPEKLIYFLDTTVSSF